MGTKACTEGEASNAWALGSRYQVLSGGRPRRQSSLYATRGVRDQSCNWKSAVRGNGWTLKCHQNLGLFHGPFRVYGLFYLILK